MKSNGQSERANNLFLSWMGAEEGAVKRKIVVVLLLVRPPWPGLKNKNEGGRRPAGDLPATHQRPAHQTSNLLAIVFDVEFYLMAK